MTFLERTGDGQSWERRVLFEGGLDVDFAFIPVNWVQGMAVHGLDADSVDLLRRGYRVLLDKDALVAQLRFEDTAPGAPPTPGESEFLQVVNDFCYHTVWTAKHLRRGELWWAKGCCDIYLKELLRRMLEWHAQATRLGVDTWMRGRFLEEWADPRAVQALPKAFAHYEAEDIWRALFASMELFHWLEREAAERWNYGRPLDGEAQAAELTRQLFDDRLCQ